MRLTLEQVFYIVTIVVTAGGWLKSMVFNWVKLTKILEQVTPNGGKSMNDQVAKGNERIRKCEEGIEGLRKETSDQSTMLGEIKEQLSEMKRRDKLGEQGRAHEDKR